ncbi:ER to Golgi transport-related protein [Naematelia encephala]|uniref:ER to Golgi transport-related protein n=1 Tax=Naematelia encephala TaxID=71784 RepID=A0A1Y2BGS5_9TREE|nr:ER to Golgi transport-related protein [Naematelia encephala]
MNPGSQPYPNVSPYPTSAPGVQTNGPPTAGPGAGFPPRSGLAGMQPHSLSSTPIGPGSGAGLRGGLPEEKNVAQLVRENTNVYARRFQALLDRSTPHVAERWMFTGGIFLLFALNVILRQGWYIVCYALAIYALNLFLAFLQPRFDPSLAEDLAADEAEEGGPGLPGAGNSKSPSGLRGLMNGFSSSSEDEEFRPFIRRLPEFKFWYSATKATVIALACTITRATDVPVYWPILLIYFLTLFGLTMRRQIQHMIKYRYVPFDLGKKTRYGRK